MKKISHSSGFSALETIGFMLAVLAIVAYSYPRVTAIMKETNAASRAHAVCVLEAAKSQFDQDARPDDKKRFDAENDASRFVMLNALVTPNDPDAFSSEYKVTKVTINELGKNVEVE